MQHLDGPGVHCNVLTGDHKNKNREQNSHLVDLLCDQKGLDVSTQVEQDRAHDQLCWNDPRAALAYPFDMVKLDERRPKDFEAERHRTEHDLADLAVSQVLLENDGHRRQEKPERKALERVQDH